MKRRTVLWILVLSFAGAVLAIGADVYISTITNDSKQLLNFTGIGALSFMAVFGLASMVAVYSLVIKLLIKSPHFAELVSTAVKSSNLFNFAIWEEVRQEAERGQSPPPVTLARGAGDVSKARGK